MLMSVETSEVVCICACFDQTMLHLRFMIRTLGCAYNVLSDVFMT